MLAHAHTWACTSHSRRPPTIHEGTSTTIVITPPPTRPPDLAALLLDLLLECVLQRQHQLWLVLLGVGQQVLQALHLSQAAGRGGGGGGGQQGRGNAGGGQDQGLRIWLPYSSCAFAKTFG